MIRVEKSREFEHDGLVILVESFFKVRGYSIWWGSFSKNIGRIEKRNWLMRALIDDKQIRHGSYNIDYVDNRYKLKIHSSCGGFTETCIGLECISEKCDVIIIETFE